MLWAFASHTAGIPSVRTNPEQNHSYITCTCTAASVTLCLRTLLLGIASRPSFPLVKTILGKLHIESLRVWVSRKNLIYLDQQQHLLFLFRLDLEKAYQKSLDFLSWAPWRACNFFRQLAFGIWPEVSFTTILLGSSPSYFRSDSYKCLRFFWSELEVLQISYSMHEETSILKLQLRCNRLSTTASSIKPKVYKHYSLFEKAPVPWVTSLNEKVNRSYATRQMSSCSSGRKSNASTPAPTQSFGSELSVIMTVRVWYPPSKYFESYRSWPANPASPMRSANFSGRLLQSTVAEYWSSSTMSTRP